eukprot:1753034-Pleurochrysis_carterae.AAC.1
MSTEPPNPFFHCAAPSTSRRDAAQPREGRDGVGPACGAVPARRPAAAAGLRHHVHGDLR